MELFAFGILHCPCPTPSDDILTAPCFTSPLLYRAPPKDVHLLQQALVRGRRGIFRFSKRHAMATFYVLPPRALLGECLARFLRPYMPGVTLSREICADAIDSLVAEAVGLKNACVVHREEL